MIAFLGTGHLGANFVKALLNKGNKVQVWNRTAQKAKMLETNGAIACENIIDAVKGVNRIHLTLKDDAAVDEVLTLASEGFTDNVIITDHTTTSKAGAIKRTEYWQAKGYTYLHAPVFMGPQNALESTGFMLVSGSQELIALLEPELSAMTGKVINFGTETGKASGIKLIGNLLLVSINAGFADMLALTKAMDIPVSDVEGLFNIWNPGIMLPARLKKMTADTFDQPTWELAMARKDVGLMIEEARQGGVPLAIMPAIAAEMDNWISNGHGKDDYTVVAKNNI